MLCGGGSRCVNQKQQMDRQEKKTNQMQKWATIWSLQDSVGTDDCTIHRENYNGQYRIDVIWAPNIWSPDVNN